MGFAPALRRKGFAMTPIQPSSAPAMQPVAPQARARGPEAEPTAAVEAGTPATKATNRAAAVKETEPLIDPQKMRQTLEEAIERLNDQVAQNARELGFSIDEATDRLVIKVTNKETGELVRQIPAEAVLQIADSLSDLRGLLFDGEI